MAWIVKITLQPNGVRDLSRTSISLVADRKKGDALQRIGNMISRPYGLTVVAFQFKAMH